MGWVVGLLLFGVGARLFFAFLKNYFSEKIAEKSALQLKRKLTEHLFRLPLRYLEGTSSGQITHLFSHDIECLKRFFAEALSQFLFSLMYVAVLVAFLIGIDFYLAVYSLLYLPVVGCAFAWIGKGEKEDLAQAKNLKGDWLGRFQRVLSAMPTVMGYGKRYSEQKKLYAFSRKTLLLSLKSHRRKALFQSCGEALSSVGLILLLFFGAFAVLNNRMTLGQLMAFYLVFAYLFVPIGRMISFYEPYKDALTSFKRIENFLQQEKRVAPTHAIPLEKNWNGAVYFDQVDFAYTQRRVLSEITFGIQAGEKVAFVGRSGVGKSTLIRLLCGFEKATAGRIFVGNHLLNELDEATYLKQVGVVLQEDHFLEETIKENIRYGNPAATNRELKKVIELAGLDEVLTRLTKGWESPMGDGGVQLSGGERKRIALARALLKQPKLLILDEPTAPLDDQNEARFHQIFTSVMEQCTTLLVTHRFSTLAHANTIYVLDQGRIVERGSLAELTTKSQFFSKLFETQITTNQKNFSIT